MLRSLSAGGCLLFAAVMLPAQAPPEKAHATPPSELTVDDQFDPPVSDPAFPRGSGPRVLVDERHRNVVSLASYFRPVGQLLEKDGYVVRAGKEPFQKTNLEPVRIVVIANAQGPGGAPPGTQAFPDGEVKALERWVKAGGGLLLIADRAPFGEPARSLARAFGVTPENNTILMKGEDGKPTGVLTIDVAANGDSAHPIFSGVSRVVYVVGESLSGPGAILKAPRGTYSGPHGTGHARTAGGRQATRARLLLRERPRGRHRRRGNRLRLRQRRRPGAPRHQRRGQRAVCEECLSVAGEMRT